MTDLLLFDTGALSVFLPVALVVAFVVFLNVADRFSKEAYLRIPDKKHSWRPVSDENESCRCSLCEALMIKNDGVYCDSCGVCVDPKCLKKAAGRFKCKEIGMDLDGPLKHRWLKGNIPEESWCDVCCAECSEDDTRCIWCHRTLHQPCLQFLGEVCDYGKLRTVVLPPTSVKLTKRKGTVFHLQAILNPNIPDWSPLFVIANLRSGGRSGEAVLSGFRSLLNPLQVSELSQTFQDRLVYLLSFLPSDCRPTVLVAGGDGSVASVLSALYLHKSQIQCEFRVSVVPLGTGNDLSRVLGWGKEEPVPFSASDLLQSLLKATPVSVDRWCVRLKRGPHRLGLRRGRIQNMFMYNYMSVGVDARVSLDFHRARSAGLPLTGRLINKALYFAFGTQQVVERHCTGLEQEVELELDGMRVELPQLEAVVFLNISSWGAGCPLWQLKEADEEIEEQSMSDGRLEVVGIYSSFHMAQLQVGLSTPYRIGQASNIKMLLRKKVPMQVDGEPWEQPPGLVELSHGGTMLLRKKVPMQVDGEPWEQPPGLVELSHGGTVTLLSNQ